MSTEAEKKTKEEDAQEDELIPQRQLASISDVFSFAQSRGTKLKFVLGCLCAVVTGSAFPIAGFYFADSLEKLSSTTADEAFIEEIRKVSYAFMVIGGAIFVSMTLQSALAETAADEMAQLLKKSWFEALLRQDMAYYDIMDVAASGATITSHAARFRKGVGRKLVDSVQYFVTFAGCMAYCFYSSWMVTLAALTVSPLMYITTIWLIKINTSQTAQANKAYSKAGSVANTTISSIRTILSLNAVEKTIETYKEATTEACKRAVAYSWKLGVANGSEIGAFMLSYMIVTLLGSYLLYRNVKNTGCDPSGTVEGNFRCHPAGKDVLGVMIGIEFAAAVIPMIAISIEAFTDARIACYPAMQVINRSENSDDNEEERDDSDSPQLVMDITTSGSSDNESTVPLTLRKDRNPQHLITLPKYQINSASQLGAKPEKVHGDIEFHNVSFTFPTRPVQVLKNFSLKIEAGTTVALVGKSGSGKSTVIQLLERFYDPIRGKITLDGLDMKELNVSWLRQHIGLVQQEPKLFGSSIFDNIAAGAVGTEPTLEQVEIAARMANAHDFISSFPEGYDTPVGDQGAQLSGGQKQRIAIARALIKQPKILLLDEATSALDSESEATVQQALDQLMTAENMTTFVIAHRLSTIRNADLIAVMKDGEIAEMGSHDDLLGRKSLYFNLVQAQKGKEKEGEEEAVLEADTMDVVEEQTAGGMYCTCPTTGEDSEGFNIVMEKSLCNKANDNNEGEDSDAEPTDDQDADSQKEKFEMVKFCDVHFEYPARPENPVLRGMNLTVNAGETLALVGPSGCGKSTVIQLIECFYRPTKGHVEYNGVDMARLNTKWLRSEFGLVSQEPILFDTTIEENIRYGCLGASKDQVIGAAKQANAHDFIIGFPDGYETRVGAGSTLVSGGQKQRIAIARALLTKPKLLLLDEATSALDSESEKVVHETLDRIMCSHEHTVIVIAHRLSTIKNANRIAFIDNGVVAEIGTHDELLAIPEGRYKRYQSILELGADVLEEKTASLEDAKKESEDDDHHTLDTDDESDSSEPFEIQQTIKVAARARRLAANDTLFFVFGAIGAIFAGIMFPGMGFVFAYMLEVFYRKVDTCSDPLPANSDFATCDDLLGSIAMEMRQTSYHVFAGFCLMLFLTVSGFTLIFWGFGNASQRLNKRVRDAAFTSLMRQEVAWFDLQPSGELASQLADDAAMLHAFCGEPIRTLLLNASSVAVGLFVSFFFMWPFALLTLAIVPFMAFGAEMEARMYIGEDEGDHEQVDDTLGTPGGIVIETLSNIRTIASLTLEKTQHANYCESLRREKPHPLLSNLKKGCLFGLGQFIQMWGISLDFFWGGWLLYAYPEHFSFRDYIISMGALLISLYAITVAMQGAVNREKAVQAGQRIFMLIDRQSQIDPLTDEGMKVSINTTPPENKMKASGVWDNEVPTDGYRIRNGREMV